MLLILAEFLTLIATKAAQALIKEVLPILPLLLATVAALLPYTVPLALCLAFLCIAKLLVVGFSASREWHQLYVYLRNLARIVLKSIPVLGPRLKGERQGAAETSIVYRFASHFL